MFDTGKELSQNVRTRFYIGGEWIPSHSTQRVTVIDPSSEAALLDPPLADRTDVDRAIAAARAAFDDGPWPRMSGRERSVYLKRFVALAVIALAAVPCAWDSRDIHDASWLPALVSMLTGARD